MRRLRALPGLLLLGSCTGTPRGETSSMSAATLIPADAKPTCVVSPAEFASWFESGTVTLDGVVLPADSVAFRDDPNCGFYRWSQRMYLWLTSPAHGGGGERVLDSPAFFDVSPPGEGGKRTYIPHTGSIRSLSLRAAQVGPHGLPVVFDRASRMLEVERPRLGPSGRPLVQGEAGESIEIERATLEGRRPVFFDPRGNRIEGARPILDEGLDEALTVQEFLVDGIPVFLDSSGAVVELEPGQAGGGQVLMAQNGSLVYYATMVNDVFAYFQTGTKNGGLPGPGPRTQFPTSQGELNAVIAYAAAHGKTFLHPEALAIEVKTSWVEAGALPNAGDYITMQAKIPTYDTSNPKLWTQNGEKVAELAMVGIHVVGSAKGHPEMIWATFEHLGNTPSAAYSYIDTAGNPRTVAQSTAGSWLFCADGTSGPFNAAHMRAVGANIASTPGHTISPSDTLRRKAWGAASNVAPNPLGSSTDSNTELISVNNSVRGMLASGDVRRNYYLTGSTWTISGAGPTGSFHGSAGTGNEVGTSKSCNSTMETYQQGASSSWNGTNCFSCHASNTTSVSHVFDALTPLF